MIYEQEFKAFQAAKIRYLVVGGVAINLYGILRATADLDLMVYLKDGSNVEKFIGILKELGYRARAPVPMEDFMDSKKRQSWRTDKGALVFTFVKLNSFEQIDVFLQDPLDFDDLYVRRRIIRVGDVDIAVPKLADLKAMKQMADREKDRSDVKHLEKLEGSENA